MLENLNVGIVHDWMVDFGGAEKVISELCANLNKAEVYTLFNFLSPNEIAAVTAGHPITVSNLNKLPFVERYYRYLLLSCTREVELFDLRNHDVVITSSTAVAKGALTGPNQPHFAYVNTPARYAWDLAPEYLGQLRNSTFGHLKAFMAQRMLHKFRIWDQRTAPHVDYFIANSQFIASRIKKVYNRSSIVIYPPVDIENFSVTNAERDDYFILVARLVPYKMVHMVVDAFSKHVDLELRIVGTGPEEKKLRSRATANVKFMGNIPKEELVQQVQNARCFVYGALEDFGIAVIEAQACGTPVIAYGKGGTSETVINIKSSNDDGTATGVHFHEQTAESLSQAISQFISLEKTFCPATIRKNAERFSKIRFIAEFEAYITSKL